MDILGKKATEKSNMLNKLQTSTKIILCKEQLSLNGVKQVFNAQN